MSNNNRNQEKPLRKMRAKPTHRWRRLGMELLEERKLLAADVQLLKDLNTGFGPGFDPQDITALSNTVVMFTANTNELGRELWKWDTTVGNPELVKDIRPGAIGMPSFQGSGFSSKAIVNGVLYFAANDGANGLELWKSDGTSAGTTLVRDINPGDRNSEPRALHNANGVLYFSANDGVGGPELWRSDGTAAGTSLVSDIRSGAFGSFPNSIVNIGSTVYFAADDGVLGVELWRSDGTSATTIPIADINPSGSADPKNLEVVSSTLYFAANDGLSGFELWRTNGTSPGTARVTNLFINNVNPSLDGGPTNLKNVNGVLFFAANDGTNGFELWRSNGTAAGTTMAHSLAGTSGLNPAYLTSIGGSVYYKANTALYRTTTAGVSTLLQNSVFSEAGSRTLLEVNGTLYFDGDSTVSGRELWKSDGTVPGTIQVRDIAQGSNDSSPKQFVNLNGTLFFSAWDPIYGRQLWKSDGNEVGTVIESESRMGKTGDPQDFTRAGDKLFFLANRIEQFPTQLWELWVTDGTANGTVYLKSDVPMSTFSPSNSGYQWLSNNTNLVDVNGVLYFVANGSAGLQLWKSDGTAAGTMVVATDGVVPVPNKLVNFNGTLYFEGSKDGEVGLWRSESSGTFLVYEFPKLNSFSPRRTSVPPNYTQVGNLLYFDVQIDSVPNTELWRSDGTTLGTIKVTDLGVLGFRNEHVDVNGTLYFIKSASVGSSEELWRSDGTTAGTQFIRSLPTNLGFRQRDLTNVNGQLYFVADDGVSGRELWKSDGTTAGTIPFRDVFPGSSSSHPDFLTNVNGSLYFVATNNTNGRELWKSDGTPAGTNLFADLKSPGSSEPRSLQNVDGSLYFIADSITRPEVLWKSDGTNAGTLPITDAAGTRTPPVNPLSRFGFIDGPASFGVLGPNVFFSAVTDELGYELYGHFNEVDYGDAPTLTTGANNGARHAANGPRLGLLRDSTETNGTPSASATSDDLNGSDDEDGVVASSFVRGSTTTITVSPRNVTGTAKLDAWFDWNRDGDWNDVNEQVFADEPVSNADLNFGVTVPNTANTGSVAARFRISDEGGLAPTGFAFTGEVEDYVFNVMQDLVVNLPSFSNNTVAVRRSGANVQVINTLTSAVLANSPLAQTFSITLNGSTTQADNIVVDYNAGGFFSLLGGINVVGGTGNSDSLVVNGTGATQAVYSTAIAPAGQNLLTATENGISNVIRYGEFETMTFQNLLTFSATSTLSIGSNSVSINAVAPIDLSNLTLIAGGVLSSDGTLSLGSAESIIGYGTISAKFVGEASSYVQLNGGDLSIGNATSSVGFSTRGLIDVGANELELLDSNQAVLGALTTLGRSGVQGVITAANGMLLDFGNNITGVGTINTPNNVNQLLMNNGSIVGASASDLIMLSGYVKGVGTLNNVSITGTNSPGFSPAVVQYGNVAYSASGTVVMEIGGTTPGSSGHDQINHTGTASLGGTLDIQTINGFTPVLGQSFVLMTATAGFTGTFASVKFPAAPAGLKWDLIYSTNQIIAQLGDIIDITSVVVNGATTNLNRSGIGSLRFNFDQPVTIASPTSLILRNHTTGNTVSIAGATLSGNGTSSVTWNLASVVLPDGRYTAELPASQVLNASGRPLAFTNAFEFHKRRGDMNGDAAVNFADYGVIGANFDPLSGIAYRPGDADGNGAINFADYGVIGASFGPIALAGLQLDFGDAAETGTNFATTLSRNGARHVVGSTLVLGSSIDAEGNGQPSANADGDGADENGVTWGTMVRGQNNSIGVTVTTVGTANLSAWLDWNGDGDWDDAGEQALQDVSVVNGLNTHSISVPSTSIVGDVTARVRVSQTAGYGYRGLAASGEVEDYRVAISAPQGGSMVARPIVGEKIRGDGLNQATDAYFAGLIEEESSSSKRTRKRLV